MGESLSTWTPSCNGAVRVELSGQRMKDAQRVASIDQIVFQRLNHAAVVEGLTQQQSAAVAGSALAAQLNTDRAVA